MPKLYEEEPSAILYKQLHPRIASLYKTFGDEAWTQHTIQGKTSAIQNSVRFYDHMRERNAEVKTTIEELLRYRNMK
jgi:septation ring formation regulator EzrA